VPAQVPVRRQVRDLYRLGQPVGEPPEVNDPGHPHEGEFFQRPWYFAGFSDAKIKEQEPEPWLACQTRRLIIDWVIPHGAGFKRWYKMSFEVREACIYIAPHSFFLCLPELLW
jgi:hypothetical protein